MWKVALKFESWQISLSPTLRTIPQEEGCFERETWVPILNSTCDIFMDKSLHIPESQLCFLNSETRIIKLVSENFWKYIGMHAKYEANCCYWKINAHLSSAIPCPTLSGKWIASSVVSLVFPCFCFIILTKFLRVALDTISSIFSLVLLYILADLICEVNVIWRTWKIRWALRHKVSLSVWETEFCHRVKSLSEWCPSWNVLLSWKKNMRNSAYWVLTLGQVPF